MLVLLLGTGLYLSLGLRFMTVRKIPVALRLLLQGSRRQGEGDISPFNALMTSLSATIGTAISPVSPPRSFWRPWRAFLDVDYRSAGNGHEIRRGGVRGTLSRAGRTWQLQRRTDVLHTQRPAQALALAGGSCLPCSVAWRLRPRQYGPVQFRRRGAQ